jgi:O-antigen ligase
MLAIIGTAIILTQTRAALVATVIVAFFALRPAAGRGSARRWQFGMILAVLIIFALPVAGVSGLSQRAAQTTSGEEKTATDHVDSLRNGVDSVVAHPFGQGLGTSAGVGQRFQVQDATVTENYYLQVGVEVGILGLGIFVALTLAMLRRLNRAAKAVPDLGISAVRGAAVGLAVGAFFLHTWNDFGVAWTLWGLAGASIGIAERWGEKSGRQPAHSSRAIH